MEFIEFKIEPIVNLDVTSKIIGDALDLHFEKDTSGFYEEFPAYVAKHDSMEFTILGNPDPEDDIRDDPTDHFALIIESESDINHDKVIQYISSKLSKDSRIEFSIID